MFVALPHIRFALRIQPSHPITDRDGHPFRGRSARLAQTVPRWPSRPSQPRGGRLRKSARPASIDVIRALAARESKIGMDGPGGWPVNVIVSHLWRATKDQKACTQACPGVPDACAGNGRFLNFSNSRRRESSR